MELASWQEQFYGLGVNVAGMTYDSVVDLKAFHDKVSLGYPLLHDEAATHVTALGILNEQYPEGHRAFGIPHPGALLLDANSVVRGKFAIAGYKERPSFEVMLQAASELVQK